MSFFYIQSMKKILALSALSLALLACGDDSAKTNSPEPEIDLSADLVGMWTTDTTLALMGSEIPLTLDLTLDANKSLTIDFDAGAVWGDGSATGKWSYANDSLYLEPTDCQSTNAMTCALFGGKTALSVKNLDADSWTTDYPLSTGALTVQFDKVP